MNEAIRKLIEQWRTNATGLRAAANSADLNQPKRLLARALGIEQCAADLEALCP
jgi:hypothetical protein